VDGRRFDAFVRTMAAESASRRTAARLLAGGGLAALFARAEPAAADHSGKCRGRCAISNGGCGEGCDTSCGPGCHCTRTTSIRIRKHRGIYCLDHSLGCLAPPCTKKADCAVGEYCGLVGACCGAGQKRCFPRC
jgi:hypothetical protein